MNKLDSFLNPTSFQKEKEVIISKRFKDENGEIVPFKIRPITQEENAEMVKKSKRFKKVNGQMTEAMDSSLFLNRMIVKGTVEPDFTNRELCERYGVLDPLELPGKMLLAGEYAKLAEEINDISGFNAEEIDETAKN